MNIALRLAYDGTDYHGWQFQPNLPTIQGALETALGRLYKRPVSVIGCGRTDAGVHAENYTANFRAEGNIPLVKLPPALNSLLPPDIAVFAAREVSPDFHAVFSCERKEYTYRLTAGGVRDPFLRRRAWRVGDKRFEPGALDKMRRAAELFVGTHDFAAVRSTGTDVKSTVRTVFSFDISENLWYNTEVGDSGTAANKTLEFRVAADGFLYNMVRAMTGTLVYVGQGKFEPDYITRLLESRDRSLAGPTAPPVGLYLTAADYKE